MSTASHPPIPKPFSNYAFPKQHDAAFVFEVNCSFAFAYSAKPGGNRRRLENPFQAPWSMIWRGLIAGMKGLVFNDQHLLGTLPPATEVWDDLNTSRSTAASSNRTRLQPDGALLFLRVRDRDNATYPPGSASDFGWWCLDFIKAGMPMIWEAKRPPKRHCKDLQDFEHGLHILFAEAEEDLEDYAYFVFRNHPEQHDLILLAAVGEWWSMRRARRSEFEARPTAHRKVENDVDFEMAPRVERRRRPDAPEETASENSGNEREDLGDAYTDDEEVVGGRQDSISDIQAPQSDTFANLVDAAQFFTTPPRKSRVTPGGNLQQRFPGLTLASPESPSPSPAFQYEDLFTQDPSPLASKIAVVPVNDPLLPLPSSPGTLDPDTNQYFPFNRYVEADQEENVDNIDDAWPADGMFTDPLLLSSEASNQRFYVLHKWFWEICNDPQDYSRG